jgi:hypothetical protein
MSCLSRVRISCTGEDRSGLAESGRFYLSLHSINTLDSTSHPDKRIVKCKLTYQLFHFWPSQPSEVFVRRGKSLPVLLG